MTISSIFQRNDADVSQTTIPNSSSDSYTDTDNINSVGEVLSPKVIPNLAVATSYSGFRILVTVNVDATTDVSETFDLLGTSDGTAWTMSQNSVQSTGGDTNVAFTIDSSGQIKYTCSGNTGFVKRTFQWLKQVL
jgi:hypothetical protein